jgi:ribosomal protein S18 acetylase RimI-like enzyme
MQLPAVGTRVSLRYRLPADSVPPLTDVVGHLIDVKPMIRVRTKRGDVVDVWPDDVVAVRALADAPVRTGEIRNLEHAAALAWPGVEHQWLGGWLLRFGHGSTRRANSAVPLDVSANMDTRPIVDWYAARAAAPLLAAPDRLFRLPPGVVADGENVVMTADLTTAAWQRTPTATIARTPDDAWLATYERDVPVDVLTAVIDGELAFATVAGAAVGRAAVTSAPDGTRWAGLSALHVVSGARRRGLARTLCADLLSWATDRHATRAYVQVLSGNAAAIGLYESMGFSAHHRSRYVSLG